MVSKGRRCSTPGCKNKRKGRNTKCSKCLTRIWAERHPISYTLAKLRNNAKRRGKQFTITLEQFTAFCLKHEDYLTAKGRNSHCLSIDRIKSEYGYHIWNIRLLTVGANSARAGHDTAAKRWPEKYGQSAAPSSSEPETAVDPDAPFG
jgi:hypothetical protein